MGPHSCSVEYLGVRGHGTTQGCHSGGHWHDEVPPKEDLGVQSYGPPDLRALDMNRKIF